MVIFWVVIAVLFAFSVILIAGKGAWLIAGYNTMNADEKKKYDQKKLTRAVGIMLLLTDVATIPLIYVHHIAYWIFYGVFICAATIILIVYANTKCFASGVEIKKPDRDGKPKKRKVIITVVIVIIVLLVAGGSTALVVTGERPPVYTVSMEDSTFAIESMYGQVIDLSDITSIKLKPELPDDLSRSNGYGGFGSTLKGECRSSSGDFTVFLDTSVPPFIYLTTSDGNLIFNAQTAEDTRVLFAALSSAVVVQ